MIINLNALTCACICTLCTLVRYVIKGFGLNWSLFAGEQALMCALGSPSEQVTVLVLSPRCSLTAASRGVLRPSADLLRGRGHDARSR